jgi:hypothetical protein
MSYTSPNCELSGMINCDASIDEIHSGQLHGTTQHLSWNRLIEENQNAFIKIGPLNRKSNQGSLVLKSKDKAGVLATEQ